MIPKPTHLSPDYAAQFQDPAVAAAYRHRPPYPDDLYVILGELIGDHPRRVLDLGTGSGVVARHMADLVDHVDAVDISRPLLDIARSLPNGNHPRIRWIHAAAEDAPLDPPYGLATAGSSLHWMDWNVVLPRIGKALSPGAFLAIFYERANPSPWSDALNRLIPRFSTNRDYHPYNLIDELVSRRFFTVAGERRTQIMSFSQSIDDHIESMHARNGFSRDRMTPESAAEFDRQMRALVEPHCRSGVVSLEVFAEVIWGIPAP
ncbi:MAG TPA: class I SAM-dependent methyltransferase [Tepidisphaeraceae bacterium]|jgi:SAM-dependent methyltransferase